MHRNSFIISSFLAVFSFFFLAASSSAAKITESVSINTLNTTTDAASLSEQTVFSTHPPTVNAKKPHIGAITPNLPESVTGHVLYLIHHDRVIDRICHYDASGFTVTPKSTTKLLTGSTKLADHHLFPRQFQKFFKSNGVNIDDFTVTVDHNVTHLKGIHGKGNLGQMPGKWNKAWADFIRNNPNASQKQIFQQAGKMMDEFGIGHLPIHKFKN